ncbi:small VCP/p97-interacting protein [Mus pahari]|uniref:small VCP/p97-interacting protein n=1 Tax=Mus pahari TaxID=10093 RepID=UPI000A30FE59|nr:small VCP/p97-interacting protein [Mus pahari]
MGRVLLRGWSWRGAELCSRSGGGGACSWAGPAAAPQRGFGFPALGACVPMGLCFPCPAESAPPSPSPEEKREKLAEAAERRQKEAAARGILDIQSVEAKKKKKEQLEKQMATSGPPTAGGLRWTVS